MGQETRAKLVEEVQTLRQRLTDLQGESTRPRSQIELVLRERVKELDCLYNVSKLSEIHFRSADRFLQSVADRLPASFLYSDLACARIVWGEKSYRTEGFKEGPWRLGVDILFDGKAVGRIEVFYLRLPAKAAEDPFLHEEHALLTGVAERVGSVLMHMKAEDSLRDAHAALQREHQALQDTNMALRTVLSRLEDEKREIRDSIVANVQKILMPIIFELEMEVTGRQRSYVTLLRQTLTEIASPFLSQISRNHLQLSPVEIAITTMIRNGLSTKEIAQLRCISPATVRRHRENIRRKLKLRSRKINLVTFLQSSARDQSAVAEGIPNG
jgi:DNA-binding CsgD family transcriptional regulator